jgi:hypothetical protein
VRGVAVVLLLLGVLTVDARAAEVPCPDPQTAHFHISDIIPTYDYNPSASPGDLAVGHDVVVGTITDAGLYDGDAWVRIGSRVVIFNVEEPEYADPVDRSKLVGLRSLAIVNPRGVVRIEGWYLACSDAEPAVPGIYAGGGDGWPVSPSIDDLQALLANPPQVTHGAVVRRSGVRPPFGDRSLTTSGTLTRRGRCLFVDGQPVVWPPGTRWRPMHKAIRLADGRSIAVGAAVTLTGGTWEVGWVSSIIGERAGAALDSCAVAPDAFVFDADDVALAD